MKKGQKHSEETKRRMSLVKKGKTPKNIRKLIKSGKKTRFTSDRSRGNTNGFKKGNTPWNKNKKGVMPKPWNKGVKTGIVTCGCFKKGHVLGKGVARPYVRDLPQNFRFKDMKGKNNPAYTGYNSKRHNIKKIEWLTLRNLVLERDMFKCQRCGKTHHTTILDIHHKVPYAISKDNSPNNLVALCKSCHKKAEWEYNKKTTGEISKIKVEDYH